MKNAHAIQDLVQISRDGLEFYEHAKTEVRSEHLKTVFSRMAEHKRTLIAALSSKLVIDKEVVPTDGTVVGSLRKAYADVRATLSSNEDKVYVTQLEDNEDRMLKHFESALSDATDPSIKGLLLEHLPQVRACHDEMRKLKQEAVA